MRNQEKKMTTAVLRKELHTYIDTLPDQSLPALKPLLSFLSEDYWKPVIEPASPEEIAMIEERVKDYGKDPSSWVSLPDINIGVTK
jgi:hypothetical protein